MAKSVKKAEAAPRAAAKPRKSTAKKTAVLKMEAPVSISHEHVAELAHHFWSERGCVHGHHEEDWFRAEQELHARAS
jgi:hypothetical protein